MPLNSRVPTFPSSAAAATFAVLVLLYFGLILRNWHNIEDIRAMVVPFVTFGLFSGALLSVIPWTRHAAAAWRTLVVFVTSAGIASIAIVMHIVLIRTVGFKFVPQDPESYKEMSETFYVLFAVVSVVFFGCTALCGFYSSVAIDRAVIARFSDGTLATETRNELIASSITAVVALVGTILTTLLGGAAHQ